MKAKKIIGYIFIVVAIILILAIVGQLPNLIAAVFESFRVFSGDLDSYQAGKFVGIAMYWTIHISLTIVLWIYGRRWIKKTKAE